MSADHLPVTSCAVLVEEADLVGTAGCNLRVHVLANDGQTARVRVEDCGVIARQGREYTVPATALNGGRR